MRIADERKQVEKAKRAKAKELQKLQDRLPTLRKQTTIDEYNTKIAGLEAELAGVDTAAGTETTEPFLPGYMLLIDEPETALHPSAVRAAQHHLYSLASSSGWQVMLGTHHPAFVDALEDHTTIVRLHRPETNVPPKLYRTDTIHFSNDERENLKALHAFDGSIAEMFFGPHVVIIEGDTEFAAFTLAMGADPEAFPIEGRPLLLRARGKWTIPILIRMLSHFQVNFSVLHDIDAPRSRKGARRNGAYTANLTIVEAVKAARDAGVKVVHRVSCPEFERHHNMALPSKDKPFEAWRRVQGDNTVMTSVRSVLDDLVRTPTQEDPDPLDGRYFEDQIKAWADRHAKDEPAFNFSANDGDNDASD